MAGCAGKLRIEASTTLHSHTAILLHLHKNRTLVRILFTNSGAPRLSFRVTAKNLYHPGIWRGHGRYKLVPAKSRPCFKGGSVPEYRGLDPVRQF